MNNEKLLTEILGELKTLNSNFSLLFDRLATKRPSQPSTLKPKPLPLTKDEIEKHQERFGEMYQKWLNGAETEVAQEFESFTPDELRRFADSNNLNVTTKMPKDKVLNLISIRFREKKLLTQNINATKPLKDSINSENIKTEGEPLE